MSPSTAMPRVARLAGIGSGVAASVLATAVSVLASGVGPHVELVLSLGMCLQLVVL
jgi:hypothetical protein